VIIDLPSTDSSKINKALVEMREKGGSVALGRVLTLVIVTEDGAAEDPIAAANAASFEHPCRVIVLAMGSKRASARLDAQIRVGGDAGASEVVVLRLYGPLVDHGASVVVPLLLADAPVVAWWPGEAPEVPSKDPIGMLAERRITDAASAKRPNAQLAKRRDSYQPGDTDLSWTRITRWRGLLASTLDQPPHDKITSVTVAGATDSPSADLLAAWLAVALKCPVKRVKSPPMSGPGLHSVVLTRRAGDISLVRPQTITAELKVANQPERHVALPRRGLRDCLSEELRRLDADDVYAEVLTKGMALVAKQAESASKSTVPKPAAASKADVSKAAVSKAAASKAAAPQAESVTTRKAPTRRTKIAAAAASVDDPPVGTDDGSPTGVPAESVDPASASASAGRTRTARKTRADATRPATPRRRAAKPAEPS
jgi:glucose-6-phosphate dehydrogenase assembly protein OpcA